METRESSWETGLGDARNILVRPDDRIAQETVCTALFEAVESPRAVVVSYEQSIEDWLSGHQTTDLESAAFVSVGETVRSTAATTPAESPMPAGPGGDPILEGVADATDLTTLGLTIQSHLQEFHEAGTGEVMVCFESVSALVEEVSLQRAFRFLHILTSIITAYGVRAHFHYGPSLSAQDLEILRVLFDAELDTHSSHNTSTWTLVPSSSATVDG